MNEKDMCFLPAYQMAEKIRNQEFTSLEITEAIITRIKEVNPIINAYCTSTFGLVRDLANDADKKVNSGGELGLMHIPPAFAA